MNGDEYVSFQSIRDLAGISSREKLFFYLSEIYKDLSNRSVRAKKVSQGISLIIFVEFMKIPIFICERLFASFDANRDELLSKDEFVLNLCKLYTGDFKTTMRIAFNILDIDGSKFLIKSNVKLILSHLPLSSNAESHNALYRFQIESLKSIDEIIQCSFDKKEILNFTDFVDVTENKRSDIYFLIISFFYQNKPFDNENIEMIKIKNVNISIDNASQAEDAKIKSPNREAISFFGCNYSEMSPTGMVRMPNEIENYKKRFISPSWYLKGEDKPTRNVKEFTLKEENQNASIILQDYIFKLEKNKLIKIYMVVLENAIYIYNNENKEELVELNHLSGCFVKEKGEKMIQGKKYQMIMIYILGRSFAFYCDSSEKTKTFISAFKQAFNYQNFFDYYEILDDIGEGKYGIVKLGVHKKTKEKVAIKIIKKDNLKNEEIECIKNEIDIMKICYHPNVIHLLDHFENADYIFIVMEYLPGGNLGEFILSNDGTLTEKQSNDIIHQIALGLQYLHHLGIVHRDLKPQNIMLTSRKGNFKVKIMDFGLSKVISNNQRINDSFGTINYVAPEILINKPYNLKVDIWSLGVIWYALLSGELPFESQKEENVAKKTIFSEVSYRKEIWEKYKKETIDIVKRCLNKNQDERATIDDIINNKCFNSK